MARIWKGDSTSIGISISNSDIIIYSTWTTISNFFSKSVYICTIRDNGISTSIFTSCTNNFKYYKL